MNARIPRVRQISPQMNRDIKIEARQQCIEQLRQYEMELDSVALCTAYRIWLWQAKT